MQTVFYAGATITTGDDIARAFCRAVLRVSLTGQAELVEVPCRRLDGGALGSNVTIATVIVVPGVAVASVQLPDDQDELSDPSAVERLVRVPPTPRAIPHDAGVSSPDVEATYDFDEWM